jgi:DNA-binding MarR family transcriptional regulator
MMSTAVSEKMTDVSSPEMIVDLLRRTIVELQPGVETLGEHWPQLTLQQLRIMHILYGDGPTRVSTLARRLQVSTPTVTGILDRLVQRGMTSRDDDPSDRRVVLNVLTALGLQVIESLHPVQSEHLNQLVERLTDAERRALADGLHVLLSATARAY